MILILYYCNIKTTVCTLKVYIMVQVGQFFVSLGNEHYVAYEKIVLNLESNSMKGGVC